MRSRSFRLLLHPAVVGVLAGVLVIGLWRLTAGFDGSTDPLEAEPTIPTVPAVVEEHVSLDGGWSRVDLPGAARLRNVWEVGGTLYAAGWDSSLQQTVVWTSPDGAAWRQVLADEQQFDSAVIHDMVGFNGIVVAVGAKRVTDHSVFGDVAVPAVWRSFDGEVFFPVPGLRLSETGDAETDGTETDGAVSERVDLSTVAGGFSSIQEFDGALLVGGWEGPGDLQTGSGDTQPGLWNTADLSVYEPLGSNLAVEQEGHGIVRTLTTDGSALVAAGTAGGTARIWTSTDGVTWTGTVADPDVGSVVSASTPIQDGAVLLGRGVVGSGEQVADAVRIWRASPSGYVRVEVVGLEGAEIADVDAGSVGIIAVGVVPLGEDAEVGAVWSSDDGITWERVLVEPVPRQSEVRSVVVGEQALVLVGEVYGQPSVWVRPLGADESVVAGVGSLVVPPAWSTVFQQDEANGSVPDTVLRAGDFLYGVSNEGWLWRSTDGDVWTFDPLDAIGLEDAESIDAIVASEPGWVAIGESGSGTLWFSTDGERWGHPTLAPRCCAVAAFRDAPGFTVLVIDEATGEWFRSASDDGLVWETDETPLDRPVAAVDHTASIGRLALLWGQPTDGIANVYGSIDGSFWFPVQGPDQVFSGVEWERVWDLGTEIVAAGQLADEPVLYRSDDGVEWQVLELPLLGVDDLRVEDVGGFGDGLAVLVGSDTHPTQLLTFSGIGTQAQVPLDVASGFSGLWASLVPNDESLRILGPDHGRLTIWEWIPASG